LPNQALISCDRRDLRSVADNASFFAQILKKVVAHLEELIPVSGSSR